MKNPAIIALTHTARSHAKFDEGVKQPFMSLLAALDNDMSEGYEPSAAVLTSVGELEDALTQADEASDALSSEEKDD